MTNSLAPIGLFVFNRPWHTRQTVQTLREIADVVDNDEATFSMGEQTWTNFMPYLWEQALLKGNHVSQTV